jgi:integrase
MRKKMTTQSSDWEDSYREALQAGTSMNTRRAYRRDVEYFWAWARLSLRVRKVLYPVSVETVIRFILEHNGRMDHSVEQQLIDDGYRARPGALKVKTLRRYLASLSVAHNEAGTTSPMYDERVKLLLRRLQHARSAEGINKKQAITAELLKSMAAQCDESLMGLRDRALLLVGFASGGRRRSELTAISLSDLKKIKEGYLLMLRRSKTDQGGKGHEVPILGEAAKAVSIWLMASGLREGKLFRGFTPNNCLTAGLSGRTVNRIVKKCIAALGMRPDDFGAHSLRSGFITEAGRRGAFLPDAMTLSGHRSLDVAQGYYRDGALLDNPTAYLLD